MKKLIIAILLISFCAGIFTSCVSARNGGVCPSHDRNYFKKYPRA